MANQLTIDCYTGNWQSALRPSPPRINSYVRIHDQADQREYDDFKRILKYKELTIDFVRWMPRLKMNVYKIVKVR